MIIYNHTSFVVVLQENFAIYCEMRMETTKRGFYMQCAIPSKIREMTRILEIIGVVIDLRVMRGFWASLSILNTLKCGELVQVF